MRHDELLDKMLDAFYEETDWRENPKRAVFTAMMAAALSLAVDGLLAEPTDEQKERMKTLFHDQSRREGTSGWDNFFYALSDMLANRRSLKPESAEERVTIKRSTVDDEHQVSVWLDGKEYCCNFIRRHAEIYRLGLIAKLKSESIGAAQPEERE